VKPTPVLDYKGGIWVGLTPKHYENLSLNMQSILKNLRQKNAIISYYKECIEDFDADQRISDARKK